MKTTLFTLVLLLSGCAHLSNKGGVTLVGRGAQLLHQQGDPVLQTGQFTKEVSPDFAAGMAKQKTDDVWNDYWALAAAHATTPSPDSPSEKDAVHRVEYPVVVPERPDSGGVIHAKRPSVIEVNE